jgi:hypothetical protein
MRSYYLQHRLLRLDHLLFDAFAKKNLNVLIILNIYFVDRNYLGGVSPKSR